MLPRTSENRPSTVYERIEIEVDALLNFLASVKAQVLTGNVPASYLSNDVRTRILSTRKTLASFLPLLPAPPTGNGLQAYMRGVNGRNDNTYDYQAALNATNAPGNAVISWIEANAGTTTVNLPADEYATVRTVNAAALAPLIDALVTSITT